MFISCGFENDNFIYPILPVSFIHIVVCNGLHNMYILTSRLDSSDIWTQSFFAYIELHQSMSD